MGFHAIHACRAIAHYTAEREVCCDGQSLGERLSPPHEKAVKGFAFSYPTVDGVVLDRVRYDGIEAELLRTLRSRAFEHYIHHRIKSSRKTSSLG